MKNAMETNSYSRDREPSEHLLFTGRLASNIFSDPNSQGFAVSYFDGSGRDHNLCERIEQHARDSIMSKKETVDK